MAPDPPTRRADVYPTRGASAGIAWAPRLDPVVWPGNQLGLFTAAELDRYVGEGFVTLAQLLMPAEVTHCLRDLRRLSREPAMRLDERAVCDRDADVPRAIFDVHRINPVIAALAADPRLASSARQILGTEVYVHQSRVDYRPGCGLGGSDWHSDFEEWHSEDGMPRMRAVTAFLSLRDNPPGAGPLQIVPGSHHVFVPCLGRTSVDRGRVPSAGQQMGKPSPALVGTLVDRHGTADVSGPAGSVTFFDSNCMHRVDGGGKPYEGLSVSVVYNSVENTLGEPFSTLRARPEYLAARTFTPIG